MSQWIEQTGSDKKHNYWYIAPKAYVIHSYPNSINTEFEKNHSIVQRLSTCPINIEHDDTHKIVSGPFPTLEAAKAAYLILMAAHAQS